MKRQALPIVVSTCVFAALLGAMASCGPFPSIVPAGGDGNGSDVLSDTADELTTDTGSACESVGKPIDTIHNQMFRLLNAYRVNNGLPALKYSRTLEAAADAHARDMWQRNFFEHENPDGKSPGDRALQAGFCHTFVGENIAAGNALSTAAEAQEAWVKSPSHNENMLHEPYRFVGMGHYYDPITRYHYWVQDMAVANR